MAIPLISLRHPRAHDIVDDPVEVAGVGTGFEGTLQARVRDASGNELAQRSFEAGGTGILEVFEISANDGSEINKQVVRLVFGRALVDPYHGFAVHTVQAGDTLSAIADQFYGDPARFTTIFEANRNVLDDPDVIFPGQELRIPQ
jgi:nucleoid-associated protein YgaU